MQTNKSLSVPQRIEAGAQQSGMTPGDLFNTNWPAKMASALRSEGEAGQRKSWAIGQEQYSGEGEPRGGFEMVRRIWDGPRGPGAMAGSMLCFSSFKNSIFVYLMCVCMLQY